MTAGRYFSGSPTGAEREALKLAARPALSEILAAEGFEAMAAEVKTETDPDRLERLGRIAARNGGPKAEAIAKRLRFLGFRL